jgi:hypothetical protein
MIERESKDIETFMDWVQTMRFSWNLGTELNDEAYEGYLGFIFQDLSFIWLDRPSETFNTVIERQEYGSNNFFKIAELLWRDHARHNYKDTF